MEIKRDSTMYALILALTIKSLAVDIVLKASSVHVFSCPY